MSDKEDNAAGGGAEAANLAKPSLETLNTPGGLLRRYRTDHGVGLQELAAVLKVRPEKLEALERDDYSQLPDMVFTRALAQSICRLLGYDAKPVLALFPDVGVPRLTRDAEGLNHAFKATAAAEHSPSMESRGLPRLVVLLVLLLLLAAAAMYFWPRLSGYVSSLQGGAQPEEVVQGSAAGSQGQGSGGSDGLSSRLIVPAALSGQDGGDGQGAEPTPAQAPLEPEDAETAGAETPADAAVGTVPPDVASTPAPAAPPADTVHIIAREPVWVQIRDGANALVHQSTLPKGRELTVSNPPPLRVEIGRVDAVEVRVKGEPFDLQPFARGNVARFEVTP
ncbi:helix-turn-helix domain-containing protein [Corticibacter populi]|nr:helix-turn-helix domain-containing protein [Corticibacter populi]